MNMFEWLEKWYLSMCDGEWEHFYGVKISTMDNPGWIVQIDITKVEYDKKDISIIDYDNGDDWLLCRIQDDKFEGFGDGSKLKRIIEIFKDWIDN